jgi:hypothetical protein
MIEYTDYLYFVQSMDKNPKPYDWSYSADRRKADMGDFCHLQNGAKFGQYMDWENLGRQQ